MCVTTAPKPFLGVDPSKVPSKKKAALKARLRRLCELKKGGKLQVPTWMHKMWEEGDKTDLAMRLEQCGFDKEQLVFILV